MEIKQLIGSGLYRIKSEQPLIHQITNQVSMNDCANATIAVGASPIMTSHPWEVADIAGKAQALVLNLGTLQESSVDAMLRAGKAAAERGAPIVFDPVGAGGSGFRSEAAMAVLAKVPVSVIRGNVSELRYLVYGEHTGRGVDSGAEKPMSCEEIGELARRMEAVVAVTGEVDYISDGQETYMIHNGTPFLRLITGSGCMTTALTGAFAAVMPPLEAAAAGALMMGLAGELSAAQTQEENGGPGTFRVHLHDGWYKIDKTIIMEKGRIEYHEK